MDPTPEIREEEFVAVDLADTLGAAIRALTYQKLYAYEPYPYQVDVHRARTRGGAMARERFLQAANRIGKTRCAAFEFAMHATGLYPDWWEGWRVRGAGDYWVASTSYEKTRDVAQDALLGTPGVPDALGTGAIPADRIVEISNRGGGAPKNSIASVRVRHVDGGLSHIRFKSYEEDNTKWEGESVTAIWCDEEPPMQLFGQAKVRLLDRAKNGGFILTTFTPELSVTELVMHANSVDEMTDEETNTHSIALYRATWDDAPHIDEKGKEWLLASYKPHEREMRSKGIPVIGSGLVYPVHESEYTCEPFDIPSSFERVNGLDFGWDHPTSVAFLAYDRNTDTVYVYDVYQQSHATPMVHAQAIFRRGSWIPVSWPRDGLQTEKGSGKPLMLHYRDVGVNMLPKPAMHKDGSITVEPGITEILQRMHTGRFKVFSTCESWFKEVRMYYRDMDDGKIVKKNDDLMDATRYAVMALRHAVSGDGHREQPVVTGLDDYDPLE